jgi:hypothetical protein
MPSRLVVHRRRPPRGLRASVIVVLLYGVAALAFQEEPQLPIVVRDSDGDSVDSSPLVEDARLAIRRFDHWLRPSPFAQLTIERALWYDDGRVNEASEDRVVVPWKSFASPRDRAASRALVAGLARLYWPISDSNAASILGRAARHYLTTQVIHDQFAGTHYFSVDAFGGFVSHVIRPVRLSRERSDSRPQLRRFPELPSDPAVLRLVDTFATIERYIGWPALQHALADTLRTAGPTPTLEQFEQSVARTTGRDLRWLLRPAVANSRFDYAVTGLATAERADDEGWFESTLQVSRTGEGRFPVEVEVIFADGSRVGERWDSEDDSVTFLYSSRAPAVAAVVDPDLVLILDADRRNNARVLQRRWHVPGLRWTLQWAAWLQDMLLTTTALI